MAPSNVTRTFRMNPVYMLLAYLVFGVVACNFSTNHQDAGAKVDVDDHTESKHGVRAIQKAGVLKALVVQHDEVLLPRQGSSAQADRLRAEALGESLGVKVEFVPVPSKKKLLEALLQGQGDVIATPIPSGHPLEGVLFSQPVKYEKLLLVTGKKNARRLRKYRFLGRFELLRSSWLDDELLKTLKRRSGKSLRVVQPTYSSEPDDLLYALGSNQDKRLASVVLSQNLQDYLAYRDDVAAAKTLGRLPVSLVFRKGEDDLLEVANDFLSQYAMTPHLRERFGGDLDEIKKRGVIRVALLNNSVSYFIYRGQQVGFQFELAELLSMRLGVRLEVVIPDTPGQLLNLLVENRADVAFVTPTIDNPLFDKCGYSLPVDYADQVLVQPASEKLITDVRQLRGRTIFVRRSSQYYPTVSQLAKTVPGLLVKAAPEGDETEDLIDQVGHRQIPLTVANSALLKVELTYRDDVQGTLVLSRARPLVFAVRKDSDKLLQRLNRFVLKDCFGSKFQSLLHKYFSRDKRMSQVRTQALSESGSISPYDDMVKKIAREFGLDWRLVLAQMYQESRFDPLATSWVGAQGLMQVMPQTAKQLGLKDPFDPEQNIRAGVSYLVQLLKRFDKTLPLRQRIRFALASYNAGLGHVQDAIRLAKSKGYDPGKWFGNVEKAMLLLEKPRYYRGARNGYCRGSEPVTYVGKIQDKYDAYTSLVPVVAGK